MEADFSPDGRGAVPFCPWNTMEEMLAGLSEFVRRQRQLSLQQHCLWRQRAVDAGPLQLLLHPQPVAPRIQLGSLRSADEFYEAVDVYPFREEEVTVRTTDRFIVVSARHEERADDHGIVSRSFVRRIPLPDNVVPETVQSVYRKRAGLLILRAPVVRTRQHPTPTEAAIPLHMGAIPLHMGAIPLHMGAIPLHMAAAAGQRPTTPERDTGQRPRTPTDASEGKGGPDDPSEVRAPTTVKGGGEKHRTVTGIEAEAGTDAPVQRSEEEEEEEEEGGSRERPVKADTATSPQQKAEDASFAKATSDTTTTPETPGARSSGRQNASTSPREERAAATTTSSSSGKWPESAEDETTQTAEAATSSNETNSDFVLREIAGDCKR